MGKFKERKYRYKRRDLTGAYKPWRPVDNLLLINNMLHTQDFRKTFEGCKFTEHYTFKEMRQQWGLLLYNYTVSRHASRGIDALDTQTKVSICKKLLMNEEEQALICQIESYQRPTLETFENLLQKNAATFSCVRTAKSLFNTWLKYKQRQWLYNQKYPLKKQARTSTPIMFRTYDKDLEDDWRTERVARRREIRLLEEKIERLNLFVEPLSGHKIKDFRPATICKLAGKRMSYGVRNRVITIGRNTVNVKNDMDLTLEGACEKVSRRQATLCCTDQFEFILTNVGRIPILINGMLLPQESKIKLASDAIICFDSLEFVFKINKNYNENNTK